MLMLALFLIAADPPKATDHGPRTTDKPVWTPKDREMVVLLGSAFIEQEARDGYLETELIRLFPNKDIRVRNLGWSGDTVHCKARSYFGPPQEGFDRLRGHLQMIKPTTVICCYGANESWKGEPGIPDFRKGYEKLIDMIRQTTGATVVLMTPPPFEPRGAEYSRLVRAENDLLRYVREIRYVADGRRCILNDFADRFRNYGSTQDGITISTSGYHNAIRHFWDVKSPFEEPPGAFNLVDFDRAKFRTVNTQVSEVAKSEKSLRWTQRDALLPLQELNVHVVRFNTEAKVEKCLVDGKEVKTIRSPKTDITSVCGPERDQLEQLRLAIVKKNALFFHRWRPANETYLYGFRKHEQGNNGVEPPMFDKLVEEAEAEIARLKKPVPHKYELIRVEEKK